MKNFKFLKYTFTLVGLFIFGIFNYLFANREYYYKNLTVNADIQQDGTIQVNEIFDAYFNVRKHGIIRNVPLKYTIEGKKFRIFLEKIKVDGKRFLTYENNGEKEIKIGDVDNELTGDQRYSIHYSVYGLIRNFAGKGREELSWNVIPNGFDTHIDKVRVELKLPKVYTGFTSEDFLIAADGKSNKVEDFEGTIDWSQGNKIILTYNKTIPAGNGITLSVKFPVGYFTFDHERQGSLIVHWFTSVILSFQDLYSFLITYKATSLFILIYVLIFGALFFFGLAKPCYVLCRARKNSRAFSQNHPVVIQYYPPQGLNPAEVGLLWKRGRTQGIQIISLFYQWYANGLVAMEYNKDTKGLKITSKQKLEDSYLNHAPSYEKTLFEHFFPSPCTVTFDGRQADSILSNSLDSLQTYGKTKGRFTIKEHEEHDLMRGGVILSLLLGPVLIIGVDEEGLLDSFYIGIYFLLCFSPVFLYQFSFSYLEWSKQGKEFYNDIVGFVEFLRLCDEQKLRTLLQEDPLYIDKILPYAIALGMDTVIVKKLKNRFKKDYHYSSFINDVESLRETSSSIKCSKSSSSSFFTYRGGGSGGGYDRDSGFSSGSSFSGSSSGSSGGGGGGGGGRSW